MQEPQVDGVALRQLSLVDRAKRFATLAHKGDKRRGTNLPSIIHPAGVVYILKSVAAPERVIAAGWLHDCIEDYGVARKILASEFGEEVTAIVDDVTEPDRSLPWDERKKQALVHIEKMHEDSLLLKTADVIHNMRAMRERYMSEGDGMFRHFNAGREKQLDHMWRLVGEIERRWKENPLLERLKFELAEFKKALRAV
ncbi:hypothetical protein A3C25_00670 [Candidatus Roizmanbacteria bacterium RIFCSPHIGHO2_02_FULL_38_11]|uniref:HD/PDEase domain-containing protein n=1 Tax=Candidatus Roizmanbacteria bacterium RIFCSPHIGHO2_02_FULL_38_11 TaxID=1802039 RepID=A0A1F7H091_9BACT|nr:MAG: hypothetical protein A3C25_00670 [Candidatus Roizmanbacteria bacterium RIFCSPHIGHO2_02_FULL_38_11]